MLLRYLHFLSPRPDRGLLHVTRHVLLELRRVGELGSAVLPLALQQQRLVPVVLPPRQPAHTVLGVRSLGNTRQNPRSDS